MTKPTLAEQIAAVQGAIYGLEYHMTLSTDPALRLRLNALHAALATLEASQWRPISEAPRDGSAVIIACRAPGGRWTVCEAYHDGSRRKEPWLRVNTSRSDEDFDTFARTLWMPIPEPPEVAA